MTVTEIGLGEGSSVRLWRKILDVGLKHRSTAVQEAAADAMRIISDLTDSSADVFRSSFFFSWSNFSAGNTTNFSFPG